MHSFFFFFCKNTGRCSWGIACYFTSCVQYSNVNIYAALSMTPPPHPHPSSPAIPSKTLYNSFYIYVCSKMLYVIKAHHCCCDVDMKSPPFSQPLTETEDIFFFSPQLFAIYLFVPTAGLKLWLSSCFCLTLYQISNLLDESSQSVTTRRVATLGSTSLERMLRLCQPKSVWKGNMKYTPPR